MLGALREYDRWDGGYSKQQAMRLQTVGYGLADSPSGQAMWIYEKFWKWMDCNGDPLSVLGAGEILDNIMLYWLSNSAASSAACTGRATTMASSPCRSHCQWAAASSPRRFTARRAAGPSAACRS